MNNQKGFANIVLIVVIVVLVGVVGYFTFVKKSEPVVQQTTPPPITTESSTSQQPSPAPINETANWKTYINNKYGIVVKYPSGWEAKNLLIAYLEGKSDPSDADNIGRGITLTSLASYDPLTNPNRVDIFITTNASGATCAEKIIIGAKNFCRQIPDIVSYSNGVREKIAGKLLGEYNLGPYFNDGLLIKYTEMNTGVKKDITEANLLMYDLGMEVVKITENQYQQMKTIPPLFSTNSALLKNYAVKIDQIDQIVRNMLSSVGSK